MNPKPKSNISKNEGGLMFCDDKSKKFFACKDEFNDLEIMFMINAINRRSKDQFERTEINQMCVNWLYYLLYEIENEFQEPGKVLCECIGIKLFKHLQNVKRKINYTSNT